MPCVWKAAEGTPHPSTTFIYNSKTKNSAAISGSSVVWIRKYLQAEAGVRFTKKYFLETKYSLLTQVWKKSWGSTSMDQISSSPADYFKLHMMDAFCSVLISNSAQTFHCYNLFQMKQLIFLVSPKRNGKKRQKKNKLITLCYSVINQYETFIQHLTFSYLLNSSIQKGK